MPTWSIQLPDYIFPFPFSMPSPHPSGSCLLFSQKTSERVGVEENDHRCLCHSEQDNDRLVTALRWQVPACIVKLQQRKEMLFMALIGQLCNLKHFPVLFAKSSCSEPTEKKGGDQTFNICKAPDSNVCAREIWHV